MCPQQSYLTASFTASFSSTKWDEELYLPCSIDQRIQGQNLRFKALRKCYFTLGIEHILGMFLKPWPLPRGSRYLVSKKPRLLRYGF